MSLITSKLGISEKALALWTLRRARELLTGRTTDVSVSAVAPYRLRLTILRQESEERKLKAITELFAEHSKKTVEYTEESLRRLRKRDEPRPIDNTETAEEANKDNIPPKLPLRARPRRWSF